MSTQQIRVSKVPEDRVQFIKALRLVGQLGLKQATDLAIYLDRFRHSVIAAGMEPDVAAHIADVLKSAGADVVLEDCSINTPMLCYPAVNTRYAWGAFRLIRKAT